MISTGLILAVIVGLFWSGTGILTSRIARRKLDFIACMALAYPATALGAWAFTPDHAALLGGDLGRWPVLAAVMLPAGICVGAGFICLSAAMRRGHHAASWSISQSALVLPYLASLALGEPPRLIKALGVSVVVLSIAFFGRARQEPHPDASPGGGPLWLLLAIGSLALLGLGQTLTTLPTHLHLEDPARLRVALSMTGSAIGYLLLAILRRRRPSRGAWLVVATFPLLVLPSHFLLYRCMDMLRPAGLTGLVYPVAVGVCILGFAVFQVLFTRETITALHWVALLIGLAGILLIALPLDRLAPLSAGPLPAHKSSPPTPLPTGS